MALRAVRRPSSHHAPALFAAGIFTLALGARLYRADAQSLWYDEGTSVALASRTLLEIARNAADDVHPPLYYWLLAAWTRAFGQSEMAVRGLSALLGALQATGIFALGRLLWRRSGAGLAGLLAALSPFLVWYGQEARMYILASTLSVAAVGLTVWAVRSIWWPGGRAAHGVGRPAVVSPTGQPLGAGSPAITPPAQPSRLTWLALAAVVTALLYTHYFVGASGVIAGALVAIAAALHHRREFGRLPRGWLYRWGAVHAAAAALFLPWLAYAAPALRSWPATSAPFGVLAASWRAVTAYAVGVAAPDQLTHWSLALAGCALLGAVAATRCGRGLQAAILVGWALVPPVLLWLLSFSRPAWDPKMMLAGAPAFELLLAWAVAHGACLARGRAPALVRTLVPVAVLAVVGGARTTMLHALYFEPAWQRDDYRGIVRDIHAAAAAGDAVILNAPTQIEVFTYYDRGRMPTYPVPIGWDPEPDAVRARLDDIGTRHADLYAVLWAVEERDPQGIVEAWLNEHRYKAFDRWYGNVRLALWAAPNGPLEAGRLAVPVRFGRALELESIAHGPLTIAAGDVLALELHWRPVRRPAADYKVFVHLLDGEGSIAAQRDMAPLGGTALTSAWQPADRSSRGVNGRRAGAELVYLDRVGLLIPPDTPAGRYRLLSGLYDPTSGRRLPVQAATGTSSAEQDTLDLGTVTVSTRR